jgi:hypothetical protein
MIDVFNFPNNDSNIDIFTSNVSTGATSWQTWIKPKNTKFIHILAIGAGGGGGAGFSATLNSGGGGGGGGAGAISSGFFPASVLPNILYIQVGIGGAGGRTIRSADGESGTPTYVSISAGSAATDRIIVATSGTFGGGGSGSGAGTAGGGAGVSIDTALGKLGVTSYYAGAGGGNGGTVSPSAGASITIGNIVTGGAGGGGLSVSSNGANGGNITGAGFVPLISGSTTIAGFVADGGSGYRSLPSIDSSNRIAMMFTGGAGGGANSSSTTGNGGNGGYGAFGCGGGGGGASNYLQTTYGAGGNGGNGLVMITSW